MYAEVSESIKLRLRHQLGARCWSRHFTTPIPFVKKSFSVILNMVVLNKTFDFNTTMLCILLM